MASRHRPRILVLEDEWMIASLIQTALEDAGFEVVGPVGRIAEALALIEHKRCDAAVLDIKRAWRAQLRRGGEAQRGSNAVYIYERLFSGGASGSLPPTSPSAKAGRLERAL